MSKIIYTESYIKRAIKFLKKHPDLEKQYEKTLKLLEINPHHPSLRLHQLKGKLSNLYSVSINLSYRIKLDFIIEDEIIIPIDVGNHE
ncbi:MAG: plasmid stabilization protein [Spirochaetes bacterium GWD1_27_9]|nr:MAG: plasmid stabilization protein [Spirochaetes bacterium GWB1_27_13]OHD23056.1 MAG: plasmid stabilization protein [Spirochaetes bacterium GWC1_27_15]OHD34433.1 MAG: plasmid stabilization protein [Spirochaetes bacterium GWD1_27_9]